jgi:hypothetical protein
MAPLLSLAICVTVHLLRAKQRLATDGRVQGALTARRERLLHS